MADDHISVHLQNGENITRNAKSSTKIQLEHAMLLGLERFGEPSDALAFLGVQNTDFQGCEFIQTSMKVGGGGDVHMGCTQRADMPDRPSLVDWHRYPPFPDDLQGTLVIHDIDYLLIDAQCDCFGTSRVFPQQHAAVDHIQLQLAHEACIHLNLKVLHNNNASREAVYQTVTRLSLVAVNEKLSILLVSSDPALEGSKQRTGMIDILKMAMSGMSGRSNRLVACIDYVEFCIRSCLDHLLTNWPHCLNQLLMDCTDVSRTTDNAEVAVADVQEVAITQYFGCS